jgi:hypothetical protein
MQRQLEAIIREFSDAQQRLQRLSANTSNEAWIHRADPARWSISECIAHLSLTTEAFLPILKDGIAHARQIAAPVPARYRRDLSGWLLWKTIGPPVRLRIKTTAPFLPAGDTNRSDSVREFNSLQAELIQCVKECDGLPIQRIRVTSPFEARVKYNLYSALTIIPRHQHRHLWQAEQVGKARR